MTDQIELALTKEDGGIVQERVPIDETLLDLSDRQLVGVSDNIAQLTGVAILGLDKNSFAEIPSGVLALTQLAYLNVTRNRLVTVPREIGQTRALTELWLGNNSVTALPREIGRLCALSQLWLSDNEANARANDSRSKLPEIFAATTWPTVASIRERAFVILTALQPLFIPALLVEILDEAFPNSIPMFKKWELVTAVKHFHQRRGIER